MLGKRSLPKKSLDEPALKRKKYSNWKSKDLTHALTSLQCHPSDHLYLCSLQNGDVNIHRLDLDMFKDKNVHTFHHPHVTNKNNINKVTRENSQSEGPRISISSIASPNKSQKVIQSNDNDNERKEVKEEDNLNTNDIDDEALAMMTDEQFETFLKEKEKELKENTLKRQNQKHIKLNVKGMTDDEKELLEYVCVKACFNKQGDSIVTIWNDNTISIIDLHKQTHLFNVQDILYGDTMNNGETSPLTCLNVYNQDMFATGYDNGTVKLWDLREARNAVIKINHRQQSKSNIKSKSMETFQEQQGAIVCMFSVWHRNRLFAGSNDGLLSTWDLRKNKLYALSDNLNDEILSLTLMKFGKKLCSGMISGYINIWEWDRFGLFSDRIRGHGQWMNHCIKFDEDSMLTACADGLIRLISLYPHRLLHVVGNHNLSAIDHMDLSFDKRVVVSFSAGEHTNAMSKFTHFRKKFSQRYFKLFIYLFNI
ncbi:hypothetical protein RFI_28238 [Reticulomyxa filosa]|uniref:Uncharacterized protein n=1 Tax=Reticulomyxa filosa TaxID=46433 RepID=X6M5F5_RETFI|nr:hypothetical protein RFI_28238 [Reticulomyxa filosa]|eukprot:ETO09149.1 hypothetical protein RFI_28238 [Reticulomyxa filosa]